MNADRVMIFACERCGRHVGCPCWSGRSAAALAEDHRRAVRRAQRSDAHLTLTEPAVASQRPTQPPVRVSLDELTATTLAHIATRQTRRAA